MSPHQAVPDGHRDWLQGLGQRLHRARVTAGLTQEALGSPDLSKSFISLLESGRSSPSVQTVLALSNRLDYPVTGLLLDGAARRREIALGLLQVASEMDMVTGAADAVRLCEVACLLMPDLSPPHRARVLFTYAHAAIVNGSLDQADDLADEIERIANHHGLGRWRGAALWVKGELAFKRRTFEAARTHLTKAVAAFESARATRTPEFVRTALSLGAVYHYTDRFDRAQRFHRRARDTARKLRLHMLHGRALTGLGMAAWRLGQLESAAACFMEAHDTFTLIEDRVEISRVLNNLGVVQRESNDLEAALQTLQRALRIREQLPIPASRSLTLDEIALTYLAMRRYGEAADAARRAIVEAELGRDRAFEAAAQVTLARALLAQDNARDAIALLKTAVSTFTAVGANRRAAALAGELAALLRRHGDPAEAPRYLTMARSGADRRPRPTPTRR